jgi:hypothetical protein
VELHIQISSKGGGIFPFNYEFALLTKKSKALTGQAGLNKNLACGSG